MINIKKLIKETLRENFNMLEAKSDFDSSMENVFKTMFKIAKAQEMFGPNSNVDDKVKTYFDSDTMGQGVYRIIISPKGDARPGINREKVQDLIRNGKIGFVAKDAKNLVFNIMANRGIEHPNNEPRDNFGITRKGLQSTDDDSVVKTSSGRKTSKQSEYLENNQKLVSFIYGIQDSKLKNNIINMINDKGLDGVIDVEYDVPGSPMSDAIIKSYLIYGEMILDNVIINTPGFDAYTTYGDAKDTDAYKQMIADPERSKKRLRMDFRTAYKQKVGKEPSEEEIKTFLQSGEENVEQYLDRNNIKKGERDLISLRNEPDFDISSLNPRDQRRYRTYQDLVRKQERGQELTNDEKREFRTLSTKFKK